MSEDDRFSEERANADALNFARQRLRTKAEKMAASEDWKNADPVGRIILRARVLEETENEDEDEGITRPRGGFLRDGPAQQIADAILGRLGADNTWRDPRPTGAGRAYTRPVPQPGDIGGIEGVLANPPEKMPEPRKWLVEGLIPRGRVTMLSADGDVGKSRLMLQLAATIATGGGYWPPQWSGGRFAPKPGVWVEGPGDGKTPENVLVVTWEDERDEVRRRLGWAANARSRSGDVHGIKGEALKEPARNRIDVLDMRRERQALWGPKQGGSGHIATGGELTTAGRSVMASLPNYAACIVDPLAAAFMSDENSRGLVREFASAVDLAAEEADCSIVLVSHPPKPRGKESSSYSGTTDWRNSVRCLLTLKYEKTSFVRQDGRTQDGREEETDEEKARIEAPRLVCEKANYAPRSAIWLVRHNVTSERKELAWFAADEESAAEEAVAAAVEEHGPPDGEKYPGIRRVNGTAKNATRSRGQSSNAGDTPQEPPVPEGFDRRR